jgi:hypothetical protein
MTHQRVLSSDARLLIIKCTLLKEIEPQMVYLSDTRPAPPIDQLDLLLFCNFIVIIYGNSYFVRLVYANKPIGCIRGGERAYNHIQDLDLVHKTVNHTYTFSARNVHTNSIESVWGSAKIQIKRMRGVSRPYLQSYLDEFCWRRSSKKTNF